MAKESSYSIKNRAIHAANRLIREHATPQNALRVVKYVMQKAQKRPKKPQFRPAKKHKSTNTPLRKSFTGHSVSTYKGKFKKTRPIKSTIQQTCLSKGGHRTMEQYGTYSDPDCVYLHHSTSHIDELARTMNQAMIRAILNKSGFRITNNFTELAVTNPVGGLNPNEDSTGLKFVLTCRNAITGEFTNYYFDTLDNMGYKTICDTWTDMHYRFIDYIRGENKDELYRLALYRKDEYTLGTQWRMGAEIYMEDMTMKLYVQSNLMIQNRTKGAGVTDDSGNQIDRVDSQPLTGWIYDFKHADMRVRHTGTFVGPQSNVLFNSSNQNGLRIIKGAEYAGAEEPFDPKYFANSSKAVKIKLDPGEIKKTSFTFNLNGKLVNILKKLRCARWNPLFGAVSGMTGKSQMIALEEQLRTPTDNKITIAYERELKTGCIVKESKRPALIETFTAATEINNN